MSYHLASASSLYPQTITGTTLPASIIRRFCVGVIASAKWVRAREPVSKKSIFIEKSHP